MDIIPLDTLLSFITTCLIIESTPGPNMAYLAILSASDGRRSGFAATAGIALGLLIVGIAAALGVAALISNSALAYQALRWGGVFYLLWLAWDGWRSEKETSPGKAKGTPQNIKFFKRGLVTNLLNPKAAVFYVAILPNFVYASSHVGTQTVTLTIVYVAVATVVHSFIVLLAATARIFLEDPGRSRFVRRTLSLALAGIALWFAWTTGRGEP
jgi:threonine/homoserine/homoserine lactone efflux protein